MIERSRKNVSCAKAGDLSRASPRDWIGCTGCEVPQEEAIKTFELCRFDGNNNLLTIGYYRLIFNKTID